MKLAQFETSSPSGRRRHVGALTDGDVDRGTLIDLGAAARAMLASQGTSRAGLRDLSPALAPETTLSLIEGGPHAREIADRALAHVMIDGVEEDPFGARIRYDSASVRLLPAITEPPMLRDFMAFEKHLLNVFPKLGREIPDEWYERPVYYKANTASLGAHREAIALPSYADELDLEFEFAAILGRDGSSVAVADAPSHVFGYTIYNDVSARGIQAREMSVGLGPAKGKDFHRAHVLGPVIVTADEIGDPYALTMRGTVNGDVWTRGFSGDMHWRFEQMIAYASRDEPLRAGEVFGSGTVGDGSGAEQGRHLTPGDVVELTVSGIGALRTTIAPRATSTDPRRPDGERVDD